MKNGVYSTILKQPFCFAEFRNKKSSILVATDVAARGLGKYTLQVLFFNAVSCSSVLHSFFKKIYQSFEGCSYIDEH